MGSIAMVALEPTFTFATFAPRTPLPSVEAVIVPAASIVMSAPSILELVMVIPAVAWPVVPAVLLVPVSLSAI